MLDYVLYIHIYIHILVFYCTIRLRSLRNTRHYKAKMQKPRRFQSILPKGCSTLQWMWAVSQYTRLTDSCRETKQFVLCCLHSLPSALQHFSFILNVCSSKYCGNIRMWTLFCHRSHFMLHTNCSKSLQ